MKILYVGTERAEAQAIATAVNNLGERVRVSWTSGLDGVANWIDQNDGLRVLVVEAQPNAVRVALGPDIRRGTSCRAPRRRHRARGERVRSAATRARGPRVRRQITVARPARRHHTCDRSGTAASARARDAGHGSRTVPRSRNRSRTGQTASCLGSRGRRTACAARSRIVGAA